MIDMKKTKRIILHILYIVPVLIIADLLIPIGIFTTTNCQFDKTERRNLITGPVPEYSSGQTDIMKIPKAGVCTPQTYFLYFI